MSGSYSEKKTCPLCGSECHPIGRTVASLNYSGSLLTRCVNCHHCWDPSPPPVAFEASQAIVSREGGTLGLAWLENFLPECVLREPHQRILDVGCWDGSLLAQLPASWERHGVEFNATAAARARKRGLTVFEQPIQGLERDIRYDVIFIMDVLEHIPVEVRIFEELHALLRPGGRLVALTGNGNSLASSVFRGRWYYFNYPEHINFYSPDSVRHSLETAGFDSICISRIRHHSASFRSTLRKVLTRCQSQRRDNEAGLCIPEKRSDAVILMLSRIVRGRDHLMIFATMPRNPSR